MVDESNLLHGTYIEQYYIILTFFKIYLTNYQKFHPNWMKNWINFCFCIATCIKYFCKYFLIIIQGMMYYENNTQ